MHVKSMPKRQSILVKSAVRTGAALSRAMDQAPSG